MKSYFSGKLFDINYRMAIHVGNANQRLASEAIKILLLPTSEVPARYKSEFDKLRKLIETTIKQLPESARTPSKFHKIRNSTASKYIKMLRDIQDAVSDS